MAKGTQYSQQFKEDAVRYREKIILNLQFEKLLIILVSVNLH